jgi:FkbM family methyltransferase
MKFDDPSWREAPVRTGFRVATSLVRRALYGWSRVPVPYDGGRSRISADLRTPMGLQLYRYGHHDPDLKLVAQLLSPGDMFVDGGANIGLFTLVAARSVGPSGKIIAFEPGHDIRLRLLENLVLNGLSQVEVMPLALSSAPGEASFQEFDIAGAGLNHLVPVDREQGGAHKVALTTLDATLGARDLTRLTLIKLDLEGAEHAALLGAATVLRDRRPDLILEIEPAHLARMGASAEAIAALLRGLGYGMYRLAAHASTLALQTIDDVTVPAPAPNVFATVDPDRVRRRGIAVS